MKKIVLVETVSMFRIRYAIECDEAEHALDTVTMNECEHEMSQLHLDEIITSSREITQDEYLKIFDADNDYLRSWTEAQKLAHINKIK